MAFTLEYLARQIGGTVKGDADLVIESIGTLAGAGNGQISFLSNSKYRSQLATTQASAVIVSAEDAEFCPVNALICANPYVGFAKIAQLLDDTPNVSEDIAATAVIHPSVTLGRNVRIGHNAVIEAGAVLGDDVQIGAGCFVGKHAYIGEGTKLWANVTIYHKVQMGKHCLVQSGTVIGSDGFGYANEGGQWIKIPQLGRVIIGDNVEIGASTTIDRGAIEDTIIGNGVILDNQIQIAHNVVIGDYTAIAGCSVIAGSTKVGRHCTFGGLVAINGHLEICDNVFLTGMTMVIKDIKEPGAYSSGMPAVTNREWRKNAVAMRNLDSFNQRLKAVEKQLK